MSFFDDLRNDLLEAIEMEKGSGKKMKRWNAVDEKTEGWKTVTVSHDDWTETFRIYMENGRVIRGTDGDNTKTTWPYKATGHGYENASGVKYETFRDGYQKGVYCMK